MNKDVQPRQKHVVTQTDQMLKIFCYQVIKIKQLSLSPASLCFNIAYGKNGLFSQRIRLRHLHTFVAVAQQGTLGVRLKP